MGDLYVVRMKPVPAQAAAPPGVHEITVKDVRVRYSEKTSNTVNVGSTAKTFTVPNTGNVPCAGHAPCSPDGKWKAAVGGVTIDAGQGQQFQNARVSCIAGPCPFTKIETGAIPTPGRTITVMVRNWSDTVTFLVEAEVTRSMPSDAIRQAYPAIYGRSMSFTLPATAEGPSIEADLGGDEIVFPLGPALQLSWAECSLAGGRRSNQAVSLRAKARLRIPIAGAIGIHLLKNMDRKKSLDKAAKELAAVFERHLDGLSPQERAAKSMALNEAVARIGSRAKS